MTPHATTVGQRLAANLEDLRELERGDPEGAEAIRCALVAHLRSAYPESVSPLGTLPALTEPIRDPRA